MSATPHPTTTLPSLFARAYNHVRPSLSPLGVYHAFAALRTPRSYVGKFLLSAFVGVHVPLIAMLLYATLVSQSWTGAWPILLVGLLATLLGTAITLLVQRALLAPLTHTATALNQYVSHKTLPALPTQYEDEAGQLMQQAQHCVTHLDSLLRLKNDLLAVISHDTRAPLSSIMLATQMLELMLNEPEVDIAELRQLSSMISSAAERQLSLMNHLLTLAHSDAGTITVQRSTVDLHHMLTRVIVNAQLHASKKGVALQLQHTLAPDVVGFIDAAKTEQALNNLVQNALKFTPADGKVTVSAAVEHDMLELRVEDTGVGMDADVLTNMFKPFTTGRRNGTAGEPGTGLGLWICHTFLDIQGGHIKVTSRPGVGSSFSVYLPLHSSAETPLA